MAIFNLYVRKYLANGITVSNTAIAINTDSWFAVLARGVHTRTAVARLPLR